MLSKGEKGEISVAFTKDIIEKLNEANGKARHSRPDYVQIVPEDYFVRLEGRGRKLRAFHRSPRKI